MGSEIELFTSHTYTSRYEGGETVYCTYPVFFDKDSNRLPYLIMSIDPDLPNLTCFIDWELYQDLGTIAWVIHDIDKSTKGKIKSFITSFGVNVYVSWAEASELVPDTNGYNLSTLLDELEKETKCSHTK